MSNEKYKTVQKEDLDMDNVVRRTFSPQQVEAYIYDVMVDKKEILAKPHTIKLELVRNTVNRELIDGLNVTAHAVKPKAHEAGEKKVFVALTTLEEIVYEAMVMNKEISYVKHGMNLEFSLKEANADSFEKLVVTAAPLKKKARPSM